MFAYSFKPALRTLPCFCVWLLSLQVALSQDIDFSTYIPAHNIAPLNDRPPPIVDGNLDDAIWSDIIPIDNFYMIQPDAGDTPTQDTFVYLTYDRQNLFVGIYSKQSNPEDIVANIMERDGRLWQDDNVFLIFDAYDTGRDGFFFQINANGARREGLVENNNDIADNWDTIWEADASIVSDGWTAEMRIPFRSISYSENDTGWGLQIARGIRHNGEFIRWATIDQSRGDIDMTNAGRLTGIRDTEQGHGLDVEVFGTARVTHNWPQPGRETDLKIEPSGNVYYKFTPSLTGTLTVNTDFSDTALDNRQVNTSRFSLFFPETRDFFLQDTAFFEFGGNQLSRQPNGSPFFSRRIGLVNGEAVDIAAGAKLSGSYGNTNIGALSTRTRAGSNFDEQQLSVVRLAQSIDDNNGQVGMIFTHGDPTGSLDNAITLGADYSHEFDDIFGRRMTFEAYGIGTRDDGQDALAPMVGTGFNFPGDLFSVGFSYRYIDDDYAPALGFSNRVGVQRFGGGIRKRWRPDDHFFFRAFNVGFRHEHFLDLDGGLESRSLRMFLGGWSPKGDEVWVNLIHKYENIGTAFTIPDNDPHTSTDITIPSRSYEWERIDLFFETASSRKFSIGMGFECCDWFDGTRQDYNLFSTWRPSKHFRLSASHRTNDISLPNGDVQIHISSIENSVNFSPDMQFESEIQYDNISQGFSFFGKLRWEIRPETELVLALSHSAITNGPDFESIQSGTTLRIGNTFRF